MKTIDFSYFIERYNTGEMSNSEKEWFEKELEGNEQLRKETTFRKHTDNILKNQNVISLRTKLSQIEKKRKEAEKNVTAGRKTILVRYAAVVAALVLIGGLALIPGKKFGSDDILNSYYKAYEPITNQRSAQSGADADYILALEFYNTHDYNKAAVLFAKVLESNPDDMQTMLLQGVSNFEEKRYPDAKQSFGKVIGDKNNLYIDHAQWYLALCYLRTNEIDKAIKLFKFMGSEDGIYRKDALKILKKIK